MSDIVSRETSGDELDESAIVREALGEAYDKLEVFHVKLSREGELRGLIGPRDISIIWERHILNSAACVPFIREVTDRSKAKTIADVGSGGGFPGIVAAACMPDCAFTLIEPMERRVEWLQECVDDMDLQNVTIIRARSDEVIDRIKHHEGELKPFSIVTISIAFDCINNAVISSSTSLTVRRLFHVKQWMSNTKAMVSQEWSYPQFQTVHKVIHIICDM